MLTKQELLKCINKGELESFRRPFWDNKVQLRWVDGKVVITVADQVYESVQEVVFGILSIY